jgi:hydrogenase maturation protease
MTESKRRVVLGLGNILHRDEGVGVHALKALEAGLGPQAGVEFVDGGVLGLSLLPLVEKCSHLLLLDAVNAGQTPGTLVELRRGEIILYSSLKMSAHQVTFQEVLGLARVRGRLPPHLHLVGVQPADFSVGLELSPAVAAAIPRLLDRAAAVLRGWGLCNRSGG